MNITPEQQIIAACLRNKDLIRVAEEFTNADEFYDHRYGAAWSLMVQEKLAGRPLDLTTFHLAVLDAGIMGIEATDAWQWNEYIQAGGQIVVERLATAIHDGFIRRGIVEAQQRHPAGAGPAGEVLSGLIRDLNDLRDGSVKDTMGGLSLGDLLNVDSDYDWLIEGLMERTDRLMLTGGEGAGKTTFMRQMAVMLAAGFHPFTLEKIPPLRVLVIDTENSERQWKRAVTPIVRSVLNAGPPIDPRGNMHIVCSGRIDVTRESHVSAIHRKIDDFAPDILFIGPLYKITKGAIQTDDDAAPVLSALDSIRDRGVAMVIEAHAGKSVAAGGERNLAPRGSSALLGWPEFGIGLAVDEDKSDGYNRVIRLTRWRGDRDVRDWPDELTTAGPLPWCVDNGSDPGLSARRRAFTVPQ